MFELLAVDGRARRGRLYTAHGQAETPAFMNVGTQAAIKGAVSADDLRDIECQIELSNTYHLHLRPGEGLVRSAGGLHKFMNWSGPILTDSGGFQIFSLAKLRNVKEEGVYFNSHIDGRKIFMSPEISMAIQSSLGSDIAMAFDECVGMPCKEEYMIEACKRTLNWLVRCADEIKRLNSGTDAVNRGQVLFGINQGGISSSLRVWHMREIAALDLAGYAIGGLAVGETHEDMYATVDAVEPFMPVNKPRYLMGVGTPANIVECVGLGIDMFDCVMPARNGRHGKFYTKNGAINIKNEKYEKDLAPIDSECACPVCTNYSRAYIRHLFKAGELLALRFGVIHNLYYYNELMGRIRNAIETGSYTEFRREFYARGG